MKMNGVLLVAGACALALLSGCSKDGQNQVHPQRQASLQVSDSFAVANATTLNTAPSPTAADWATLNANQITLQKSALGKAFLLSPTMVISKNNPIIDHLAPKVVSFERHGNQIALFELNADAVYDNLQSDKLLETFTVANETDEALTFQWNYGLSAVPVVGLFDGGMTDFQVTKFETEYTPVLPSSRTFVRKARLENNRLEIEQVSEVVVQNIPLDLQSIAMSVMANTGLTQKYNALTVKLNVSLRPYAANPNFKKRLSPFNQGIGAFEKAMVRDGDGKTDYYATYWDLSDSSKPLVYAATKGTPQEYLEAIKEGVLYWNRVAGREIIRFETDADPNATPEERKVLVHWIPWDRAGFARASMQADPLTGELIRADVYLTSAFATNSMTRMRTYLENLRSPSANAFAVLPNSFAKASVCHYERPLAEQARILQLSSEDPAMVKKFTLDMLREVTAHEVGHTLGMRHNFAGSLHSEFDDFAGQEQAELRYLKGELNDGANINSSVMDYTFGVAGGIVGAYIKKNALAYDQKFIEWFYTNEFEISKANVPAFCSDGLGDSIANCVRGDIGKNTVRWAQKAVKDLRTTLENVILQSLVTKLYAKNPADRLTLRDVSNALADVNPEELADKATVQLNAVRALLAKDSTDYAVELKLGKRGWHNAKAYDQEMETKIKAELATVGGLFGMMSHLYPMDSNGFPVRGWVRKTLLAIYERPDFKKGVTFEGVNYQLTPQEDAYIGSLIDAYSERVEEEYLKALMLKFAYEKAESSENPLSSIMALIGDSKTAIATYAQQEAWWPQLAKVAGHMLAARDGVVAGLVNGARVEIPKTAYALTTRKKMVGVATPENYLLHAPQKTDLNGAKTKILADLGKVLGKELKTLAEVKEHVKTVQLDVTTKKWVDEEVEVITEIDKKL